MSTHKIKIPFLVLTQRRKEVFLQSALDGFKSKSPKLGAEAAESPVSTTKRHTFSTEPMSTPDKRTRIPGLKRKA
jgi:hypothetical protein